MINKRNARFRDKDLPLKNDRKESGKASALPPSAASIPTTGIIIGG